MRKRDDPVIYSSPVCAAGCKKPWELWCRGCNLVFCADDAPREKHNCVNRDQRSPAAAKPEKKPKKAPEPPVTAPTPPPPDGPDLFGKVPPNGIASSSSAH